MHISSQHWRLFAVGALFVLVTCGASVWLIIKEQERWQHPALARQLLTEAQMLARVLETNWDDIGDECVAGAIGALQADGTDVAVVSIGGEFRTQTRAVGSASAFMARPEVRTALDTGADTRAVPWGPNDQTHALAAVRLHHAGETLGVVWLAQPVHTLAGNPAAFVRLLALTGLLAALATTVFVAIVARLRRRMLQRVIKAARSLSTGDLSDVPEMSGRDELAALSTSLAALRGRLADQVAIIDRQRRMLEALVKQLREGVIVARANGRIALINPAAVRMLGIAVQPGREDALVGQPVEACVAQHAVQQLLLEPNAEGVSEHTPTPWQPGDDKRFEVQLPTGTMHLLARASPLVLAEPHPTAEPTSTGRVVVLSDISELQRTIQMRTDFVANASHELRTPLSTIRVATETLLAMDLAMEQPAARQFLTKIDRQSARLQQMVADLLDLSRIESPTEHFEPEPVEVRKLLSDLHARFADTLERKQLRWATEIVPPNTVHVEVSPHLLRLALDNLVDNAAKFTEAGGQITVRIERGQETTTFTVQDTGCGIPPEDQQRVFERFYQVQRSRSGPERGTGLGLSIVRHAVGAMQGSARLESELGVGTRVSVSVPVPATVMS